MSAASFLAQTLPCLELVPPRKRRHSLAASVALPQAPAPSQLLMASPCFRGASLLSVAAAVMLPVPPTQPPRSHNGMHSIRVSPCGAH